MPYETIWEDYGVYQRYSGVVTPRDRERANNDVLGNERFDDLKYWLVDTLKMEEYRLTSKDAVVAAAHDIGASRYNDRMLMVFAVTDPTQRENVQRYMEILRANTRWQAKLFGDLDAARLWIAEQLA